MFCINCRTELPDGSRFCTTCGLKIEEKKSTIDENERIAFDASNKSPNSDNIKRAEYNDVNNNDLQQAIPPLVQPEKPQQTLVKHLNKKYFKYILGVVIIVVLLLISLNYSSGANAINAVKRGAFTGYPEQTVGEAFDRFFENPEWKSYKEHGDTYVKFTGKCFYDDKTQNARILFFIDEDNFSIEKFYIGAEEEMRAGTVDFVMDKIYNN